MWGGAEADAVMGWAEEEAGWGSAAAATASAVAAGWGWAAAAGAAGSAAEGAGSEAAHGTPRSFRAARRSNERTRPSLR